MPPTGTAKIMEPGKYFLPELSLPIPTVLPSDAPGESSTTASKASSTPSRCMGDGPQGWGKECGMDFPSQDTKPQLKSFLGSGQLVSTIPTISQAPTIRGLVSTISDEKIAEGEHTSIARVFKIEPNFQTPFKESHQKPLPTSQIVYIKPLLKPPYVKSKEHVAPPSNGLVPSKKDNERREEKTSNSSRIIYISLLTVPTKASRPSEEN